MIMSTEGNKGLGVLKGAILGALALPLVDAATSLWFRFAEFMGVKGILVFCAAVVGSVIGYYVLDGGMRPGEVRHRWPDGSWRKERYEA